MHTVCVSLKFFCFLFVILSKKVFRFSYLSHCGKKIFFCCFPVFHAIKKLTFLQKNTRHTFFIYPYLPLTQSHLPVFPLNTTLNCCVKSAELIATVLHLRDMISLEYSVCGFEPLLSLCVPVISKHQNFRFYSNW